MYNRISYPAKPYGQVGFGAEGGGGDSQLLAWIYVPALVPWDLGKVILLCLWSQGTQWEVTLLFLSPAFTSFETVCPGDGLHGEKVFVCLLMLIC